MGVRRIYRAISPYPEAAVGAIDFAQLVDVTYLTHASYPVHKLTRYGATDWRFSAVTFGPIVAAPAGVTATASFTNTTGAYPVTNEYVATLLRKDAPRQESRPSAIASCTNDLSLAGNYNTVNVPALPADGDKYIIYKKMGGSFGYVGFTDTTAFRDGPPPIQPILSDTPPKGENPFVGAGNYPAICGVHQQRLVLGRTDEVVNGTWMSRTADYENLDKAQIARADDSIAFAMASTQSIDEIKAYVSLDDLITFTGDNVWAVAGDGDASVITPGSIHPKRQSSRGASALKPLPVDNVIFYQPAQGSSFRSLGYTFETEGYKSDDISLFSSHLFDGYGITSMAFQDTPFSALWATRTDGALLCLTWQLEQEVWGWTMCETEGFVEQVACIPESGYHRVYIRVRRTINGVTRRFYERMALPHRGDLATACHLDCAVTRVYAEPSTFIDRLWHLEGHTVSAVFDGFVTHGHVVTNGRVDLPPGLTGMIITAGLRYGGRLETMPPALQTQSGSVQNNRQQVDEVVVRTIDTTGIEIGAHGVELEQVAPEQGDDVNEFDVEGMRDFKVVPPGNWDDTSYVIVEQNEPLPAYITGIFASMKVSPK